MEEPLVSLYPQESLKERLWWLVVQRLAGATLLLCSVFWINGWKSDAGVGAWRVFLSVGALSLLYTLALQFGKRHELQARLQIAGDVLLITVLVWVTCDDNAIRSPYTPLYIVSIALASLLVGARGAMLTALAASFLLTTLALGLTLGWFPSYSRASFIPSNSTMTAVGLYDVAFLVVGLLAARMAERHARSHQRLQVATQSLAHLRALHERIVESISSGVVTTDLNGRIYTFNLAAQTLLGHKITDMRGQPVATLFGPAEERVSVALGKVAAGHPVPTFETECPTNDGGRVFLAVNFSVLTSDNHEPTGIVLTFQDLTELRTLEETSRRQDRLAAVGRMAAAIAHEIRNPLAAVRGSVQVLEAETPADSTQKDLMGIVLRESDRINRIVTDYLMYARPRTSTPTSIDLCELLENTLLELDAHPEMQDNHIIEMDWPDFPMLMKADAGQLKQAFHNLALNALQAMPDGGMLRVSVQNSTPYRRRVIFHDTGVGMSPSQVEQLFEPFNSTTGGTGLGLPIAYQIIREHSGTISVLSRERQGTTITVELPLER